MFNQHVARLSRQHLRERMSMGIGRDLEAAAQEQQREFTQRVARHALRNPAEVTQVGSTASHWATQKAATAWCSDRTEHKVMDRDLCEAFAEILDQVRAELRSQPAQPTAVVENQANFKHGAWLNYTLVELAQWVELLTKRARHRDNPAKRDKDLKDAENYLAMLTARFAEAKKHIQAPS